MPREQHGKPESLSVATTLARKHVLVTGASGFLGKVFIAMLLDHVPELETLYVFMRPRGAVSGYSRFEHLLNTSPAFRALHDKHGPRLSTLLQQRVQVVEGDLCAPDLGLSSLVRRRLQAHVDLVVHIAGLVDFDPELSKALSHNVDATMHVADLVAACDHAALLHVSTCYVAGCRSGFVHERLTPDYAPNGATYDAAAEVAAARKAVEAIRHEHAPGGTHDQALLRDIEREPTAARPRPHAKRDPWLRRRRRELLRQALVDDGMRRARALGFPNTYTYSKCLAESLLCSRADRLRFAVVRPSIVESARSYPFPGWNESFNGSAPLAYVMGSWFRMVPARPQAPFDVVPVDEVGKALALCGAALVQGRHAPVYHIGTSDRRPCSVGRAAELIVLAHRMHYRQPTRTRAERLFKSRWDAILVGPDHALGAAGLSGAAHVAQEALDLLSPRLRSKLTRLVRLVENANERVADIRKMIELYMPFMHDNAYVFESRAIEMHPAHEPSFAFFGEPLDWRDYWLRIHMPGLRKYAFPLIEGRRPPRYRALHPVSLEARGKTARPANHLQKPATTEV